MKDRQLERKADNIKSDTTNVINDLIDRIEILEAENKSLEDKIEQLQADKADLLNIIANYASDISMR